MSTGTYATLTDIEIDSRLKNLQAKVLRSDALVAIECKSVTDHMTMHHKLGPIEDYRVKLEIRLIQREQEDRERARTLNLFREDAYRVLRQRQTECSRATQPQLIIVNLTILTPDHLESGDCKDLGPSGGVASRPNLYLVE